MKTLATELQDELYEDLRRITADLGVSPEHFAGRVVERAIERQKKRILDARHRAGYEHQPIQPGEFDLNSADPLLPGDDETW